MVRPLSEVQQELHVQDPHADQSQRAPVDRTTKLPEHGLHSEVFLATAG